MYGSCEDGWNEGDGNEIGLLLFRGAKQSKAKAKGRGHHSIQPFFFHFFFSFRSNKSEHKAWKCSWEKRIVTSACHWISRLVLDHSRSTSKKTLTNEQKSPRGPPVRHRQFTSPCLSIYRPPDNLTESQTLANNFLLYSRSKMGEIFVPFALREKLVS